MHINLFNTIASWLPGHRPAPQAESATPVMAGDRLQLSPIAQSSAGKTPPQGITGSFIQFADDSLPVEYWEKTLSAMKQAGMDTAIIQYTQADGTNFAQSTERVLQAADKLGMKVMVGTALLENAQSKDSWYIRQFRSSALKADGEAIATYTRQLVQQFGDHPSMAGVYLPNEVNGLGSAKDIGDFYGRISGAVKELRPDLKTMISPYSNLLPGIPLSRSSEAIAEWWDTALGRANVDILAWQDGVGGTTTQIDRIDHDLGAIAKATEKHNVELWANLEAFHRTTPLTQGFSAEPTSIDTLDKQMNAERPYATKLICFDFNHYLSPLAGEEQAKLYRDYVERHAPAGSGS